MANDSTVNQKTKLAKLPLDVAFEKQLGQLSAAYRVLQQEFQAAGPFSISDFLQKLIDDPLYRKRVAYLVAQGAYIGGVPRIFRRPFDSIDFLGHVNFKITEQDVRSHAVKDFVATALKPQTCLRPGEATITGEEKLKRLKASGRIRLDAGFFMALWEEKNHKTLHWLHVNLGIKNLDFFGTILVSSEGYRFVLCLGVDDVAGTWVANFRGLKLDWNESYLSACLESNK